MTTAIFDTYQAVNELREAGFNEAQAAAMVTAMCRVLGGNLATKEDLAAVRLEMATKEDLAAVRLEMATKADIRDMATKAEVAAVRQEMATKAEVAVMRQEMATKAEVAAVRQEMATKADVHAMEAKLTIRMGGMIFGAAGLVLAILRFFPNFLG